MLKAIHAQEDKEAARQKAVLVAEKLRRMKLDSVAKFVEDSVEETLSYMDFPYEHWVKIRTNNGLERIMKEIRRRTRCNLMEVSGSACTKRPAPPELLRRSFCYGYA